MRGDLVTGGRKKRGQRSVTKGTPEGERGVKFAKRHEHDVRFCHVPVHGGARGSRVVFVERTVQPRRGPTRGRRGKSWGSTRPSS